MMLSTISNPHSVIDSHSRIYVPDEGILHALKYSVAYEPGTKIPPVGPNNGRDVYFYGHAVSDDLLGYSVSCGLICLA
jgi:hypothetical protein